MAEPGLTAATSRLSTLDPAMRLASTVPGSRGSGASARRSRLGELLPGGSYPSRFRYTATPDRQYCEVGHSSQDKRAEWDILSCHQLQPAPFVPLARTAKLKSLICLMRL
jgi:hypothetical protein